MPARNSVAAGSLIVATLATAAGLNLSVMQLDRSDETTSSDGAAESAALTTSDDVDLVAATVDGQATAVVPVLAVGLATNASQGEAVDVAAPAETTTSAAASETRGDAMTPSVPDSTPAPAPTNPTPAPTSSPAPTPAPTSPSTGAGPATQPTLPPTAPPTTEDGSTSTNPVSTEYLTYEFEGVASIVIALHDGERLEYWSVIPEEGWVFLVEDRGPDEVKIKFRPKRGGDEAEFGVKFDDDRLKVKREY